MLKKAVLILSFLCVALVAAAQATRVRGKVVDAETGEPLPFVGVYFDGTTIGISTDLEGRYSLETRSPDALVLTAQMIGYESQSKPVHKGAFTELNFSLKPDYRQLNAAYVKPDNRYIKSILRKLDKSLEVNDPDNAPDWESRLYSKIEMDITNMEGLLKTKFLNKNLGFMQQYSDTSAITGKPFIPAMISENVSDMYHSKDPLFNREVMRASRISGLEEDNMLRQFTGSYLLKTNFYKNSISVFNLDIPNPAVTSSQIFYNYFLVDSLDVDNRKTYVLRFHPKKLVTSPTLDGEMQIDAQDFGIRSVHCRLSKASNVNWIRHINIDIDNRRTADGRWFYGDERLFIDFSIAVSDSSRILSFLGNRHIHYDEPVFKPVEDPDALTAENTVVMRDVIPGDDAYWEAARPYALTKREQGIYNMVEDFQETSFYKWNYGIFYTLITNYYEVRPWKMEFGRWARSFSYNDSEGFRMQLGGRTTKYLWPKVRLGGYFALGFKDLKPKWEVNVEWMINREKTSKLTFHYQKDFMQFSSGTGVFTAQNMFSSIFTSDHTNRQSMMEMIDVKYDQEFNIQLNGNLHLKHYRIWGNPVVPFIKTDGSIQESFSANVINAELRIAGPDERVNRDFYDKSYMFSKYPEFYINVTKGFKGITPDDFDYWRLRAQIVWKTPSFSLGYGRLNAEGGMIFGSVPFQMLKLHEGNQTFFFDRTAAACMDYYEFISDRWITGYYEHNFNGFFLGKIPWVKKLDLREVAMVRCIWGSLSKDNSVNAPFKLPETASTLEIPYVEVSVGISNILRILRVDFYWRLTHRTPESKKFAVTVGIDVDF